MILYLLEVKLPSLHPLQSSPSSPHLLLLPIPNPDIALPHRRYPRGVAPAPARPPGLLLPSAATTTSTYDETVIHNKKSKLNQTMNQTDKYPGSC